MLHQLGRYEEAIASFDRVLAINSDLYEAWNSRGIALRQLGRDREEIASYDRAVAIKPDYHPAIYNQACCYAIKYQVDLAIQHLERAIKLAPDTYGSIASTDPDFDRIRDDARFVSLINLDFHYSDPK